jgi:hypothetical protein
MAKDNNLTEFLQNTANAIREAKGGSTDPINAQKFSDEIVALKLSEQTKDADAYAGIILDGYVAYVKGERIEGRMPDKSGHSITLNPGQSTKIPQGYHNGNGTVTAKNTPSWNGSGVTTDGIDTDGLRGTWVFDEDITTNSDLLSWTFNFSSNGTNFTRMDVGYSYDYENYVLLYYSSDSDHTDEAYLGEDDRGYWIRTNYRTIEITSALSEVEDGSSLLYYLQSNATKESSVPSTAGVYYGSSRKASLTNNTIITLPVKGLKLDSDITIVIK